MRKPFAALLWKEALEVSRYSVPVFILCALLLYGSLKLDGLSGANLEVSHFSWFAMLTALVASVMGFSQTNRESRGDLWAFAIHRPVGRNVIFAAKAVVGILSLLATAGIPYAIAMWWLSVPGHRAAPFDRHLWLPGFADLVLGIVFYGAGLLAGARRSATFTRGIGFALALFIAITNSSIDRFALAILVSAAAAAVLIAAAWSTFVSGTDYDAQPPAGRIANVLAAIPAVALAGGIAFSLFMWLKPEPAPRMRIPFVAERPQALVIGDGAIVLVTHTGDVDPNTGERKVATVTDLLGRRLPQYEDSGAARRLPFNVIASQPLPIDTTGDLSFEGARASYRNSRYWITTLSLGPGNPWYFERAKGLISFYDPRTRRVSGWLGPDGYSPFAEPPASRFPGTLQSDLVLSGRQSGLLVLSGGIYRIKGLSRPILLFRPPPGERVLGAAFSGMRGGVAPRPGRWGFFEVVTTDKRTYVLDDSGRVQVTVAHDTAAMRNTAVSVYRASSTPGAPTFVWYRPRFPFGKDTLNRVVQFLEPFPSPVARYAFAGDPYQEGNFERFGAVSSQMIAYSAASGVGADVSFMSPFSYLGGVELYAAMNDDPAQRPSRRTLILTLLLNGALVVLVAWLCSRYAFSTERTALWMALTALGGPLTLAIMWLLLEWPAREPCPSCGKARVVNRERCEHCSAPFAPPATDGTELIAVSP